MDHAVDLIGNGLCEFIIVPGVVSIDRDIHTAKVGRPGRTASGQSCLWEVSARAIEMWRVSSGRLKELMPSMPCCTFAAIDLIWLIRLPSPFLMPPEYIIMSRMVTKLEDNTDTNEVQKNGDSYADNKQ